MFCLCRFLAFVPLLVLTSGCRSGATDSASGFAHVPHEVVRVGPVVLDAPGIVEAPVRIINPTPYDHSVDVEAVSSPCCIAASNDEFVVPARSDAVLVFRLRSGRPPQTLTAWARLRFAPLTSGSGAKGRAAVRVQTVYFRVETVPRIELLSDDGTAPLVLHCTVGNPFATTGRLIVRNPTDASPLDRQPRVSCRFDWLSVRVEERIEASGAQEGWWRVAFRGIPPGNLLTTEFCPIQVDAGDISRELWIQLVVKPAVSFAPAFVRVNSCAEDACPGHRVTTTAVVHVDGPVQLVAQRPPSGVRVVDVRADPSSRRAMHVSVDVRCSALTDAVTPVEFEVRKPGSHLGSVRFLLFRRKGL